MDNDFSVYRCKPPYIKILPRAQMGHRRAHTDRYIVSIARHDSDWPGSDKRQQDLSVDSLLTQ